MNTDFNYDQPYVVVGALLEKDGKFLFVHESHGPHIGKWNKPAGKWDGGESILDGAIREVLEETGYDFTPKQLLGVYIRHKTNTSTLQFVFVGDFVKTGRALKGDIDEVRWFSAEEIFAMDDDVVRGGITKKMVRDYLSGDRYPFDFFKEYIG